MSVSFNVSSVSLDDKVFEDAPWINVSNANAGTILEALGYDGDPWNFADDFVWPTGQDFLGRVLVAQGLSPADPGVPATRDLDNPNFIDCGRREGYLQERLEELRELAEFAVAHKREVTWG